MTPDLTDEDKAILAQLLHETIARDRFPLSPRVRSFEENLGEARSAGTTTRANTGPEAAGRAEHDADEEARRN